LACATIIGIIAADFAPGTGSMIFAGLACLSLFALVRRNSAAVYVCVGLGAFLLHSLQITDTPGLRLACQLGDESRAVRVRGLAVSEPRFSESGFCTFLLQVRSIQIGKEAQRSRATLFVRWKGTAAYGNELDLLGMAEPIRPPRNPGEFDMRAYLARRDVRRQLFVGVAGDGTVLRHGGGNVIMRTAQRSRRWLQHVLTRGLDDAPDVQSLISGMALGLRHQTVEDIEEPFQQTGTLHLFAVAGLHVGILAQLLWIVCMVLRLPRRLAMAFIVPALFFYAAVTGWHTSSVRAALMSAVLLCGFLIERRVFLLNSLAAAAVAVLFWDTNELFSIGFQLSFAVVATIILLADPVFHRLRRRLAHDPFLPRSLFSRSRKGVDRLLHWIARGASVSFAAWAGSLPFILWNYSLVTPVSLLANLVVVPVAFSILAGALLSILTAPFSAALSITFNNANWVLAKFVLIVVQIFAQIPGGHFYAQRWPQIFGPLAEVTVLDLGRGAAVHLRTRGKNWLFDAGSKRDFGRVVQPYLRMRGVDRLDGLLLTHGDAAHMGGADEVVHAFRPRTIIDNGARDRSGAHRTLVEELSATHLLRTLLTARAEVMVAHEVRARILFPPRGFAAQTADDQTFVIQLLVLNRPQILFLSDSGEPTERELLRTRRSALAAPIIVKGQHRSGISGSPEFLEAVRPKIIIATSRNFPNSEHITDDWAALVRARGIKLFRQDQTGAVTLRFYRDHWEAASCLTPEIFRSSN
jgi:competence protein ComEC